MSAMTYVLLSGALTLVPAEGAPSGREQLKAFGDTFAGVWEGGGVAVDAGLGVKKGEGFTGQSLVAPVLDGWAFDLDSWQGPSRVKGYCYWDASSRQIRWLIVGSDGSVIRLALTGDRTRWGSQTSFSFPDSTTRKGKETLTVSPSGNIHVWEGTCWERNGQKLPDSSEVWQRGPLPKIPREARMAMEALVGEWTFEGKLGTYPGKGTSTTAWVPGRHALQRTLTWTDKRGTGQGTGLYCWNHAGEQIVACETWSGGWSNTYRISVKDLTHWVGRSESSGEEGTPMEAQLAWRFLEPGRFDARWFDFKAKGGKAVQDVDLKFRKVRPADATFRTPDMLMEYATAFVGTSEGKVTPYDALAGIIKKGDALPGRLSIRWILDGAAVEWTGQVGQSQFLGMV